MATIKEAISNLFKVVNAIIVATSEDSPGGKQVTLTESLGIAVSSVGLIPILFSLNQLKEDWESRDDAKKEAWVTEFKAQFDLENDEIEQLIESLVQGLLSVEGSLLSLVQARKN